MERIEARVAQILNARELVLNRGADHGVTEGMRFAVLNRKGASIVDPETGEHLGSVEVEKAIVKVVRVQPKVSVARTFRKLAGSMSLSEMLDPLRSLRGSPDKIETLRTDEQTYQQEMDESESYIKRGDTAVQVSGDQYGD